MKKGLDPLARENYCAAVHLSATGWARELERYGGKVECERQSSGLKLEWFTPRHRYSVVVRVKDDGGTYMGGGVSNRRPREGETWTRGNDLPDGEVSYQTWCKIVAASLAYELVEPPTLKTIRPTVQATASPGRAESSAEVSPPPPEAAPPSMHPEGSRCS